MGDFLVPLCKLDHLKHVFNCEFLVCQPTRCICVYQEQFRRAVSGKQYCWLPWYNKFEMEQCEDITCHAAV